MRRPDEVEEFAEEHEEVAAAAPKEVVKEGEEEK